MGEPTPTPAATSSAADPTSAPKLADLAAIKYSPVTSSIATPEEIKAITQLWVNNLGLPADTVGTAAIDLARAYADVGASKSATLLGFCPTKPDVRRAALAAQIFVANVTPRQFCAYYAKVVWNLMLATNDPPANWAKAGFQEDTRFAAFDFFDAVDSTAALEPAEWQRALLTVNVLRDRKVRRPCTSAYPKRQPHHQHCRGHQGPSRLHQHSLCSACTPY
uniref:Coat protein n=1 Tax=Cymbidium mosaic virus TaxID=12178 RepID=Q9Q3U4_9VIRU|nr:coat protein [Cymbidium mosaic virus]